MQPLTARSSYLHGPTKLFDAFDIHGARLILADAIFVAIETYSAPLRDPAGAIVQYGGRLPRPFFSRSNAY